MVSMLKMLRATYRLLNIQSAAEYFENLTMDTPFAPHRRYPRVQVAGVFEPDVVHDCVAQWYRKVVGLDRQPAYPISVLETLAACRIVEIRYYKALRGTEHEFLVVVVIHAQSGERRYIQLDRSGADALTDGQHPNTRAVKIIPEWSRQASENSVLLAGHTLRAWDHVTVHIRLPLQVYGVGVAEPLTVVTFPAHRGPSVLDLAVLLKVIWEDFTDHRRYRTNCFWYARMVYECLTVHFKGHEKRDPSFNLMGTYKRRVFMDADYRFHFAANHKEVEAWGLVDLAPRDEDPQDETAGRHEGALILPVDLVKDLFVPALKATLEQVTEREQVVPRASYDALLAKVASLRRELTKAGVDV
ncbi:hypothetical protein C8R43DRAFT_1043522 [Mycena crocata]|nr:hypothetical protein C8R43DRAFT_1043522 [Mycena crocata]